jgi:DNA invertase Pin-like site-specific DNA recombinase
MKVAIYARVSTKDKQDVENQILQLREYARRSGWEITHEYIDAVSGKSSRRPQFQQMFTDASQRRFDAVLCWALDRFTREGVMETFDHIKRLLANGVQFISYTEEHFRTMGPTGQLMIAIAAWIAEQERARLVERIHAGIHRARVKGTKSGKAIGRPKLVVDRSKAAHLRAKGKSIRQIAAALHISNGSAHALLSR